MGHPTSDLGSNKTVRILEDAERGGYGVIASIVFVSRQRQNNASLLTDADTISSTFWGLFKQPRSRSRR